MGIFQTKTADCGETGGWLCMAARLGVAIEIFKIALASGFRGGWRRASPKTRIRYLRRWRRF